MNISVTNFGSFFLKDRELATLQSNLLQTMKQPQQFLQIFSKCRTRPERLLCSSQNQGHQRPLHKRLWPKFQKSTLFSLRVCACIFRIWAHCKRRKKGKEISPPTTTFSLKLQNVAALLFHFLSREKKIYIMQSKNATDISSDKCYLIKMLRWIIPNTNPYWEAVAPTSEALIG